MGPRMFIAIALVAWKYSGAHSIMSMLIISCQIVCLRVFDVAQKANEQHDFFYPQSQSSMHHYNNMYFNLILRPGRVAQSVTCLATDASLTAALPGVASSIPAQSHTFEEIDHEIISMVILLPSR